jgi:hypothetical protein
MASEEARIAHDVFNVNADKASAENFGKTLSTVPTAESLGVQNDVYLNILSGSAQKGDSGSGQP